MGRHLSPGKLVVASHNAGKVSEIAALLSPYGVVPVSAADLGLPEPEETGDSFRANAELKALAAARAANLPALADDSGLCADAAGGAPGIYSARWAGPTRDFALAMTRLNKILSLAHAGVAEIGLPADRAAAFVCVLSLAWPDGHVESFEGRVTGDLVWPPRGDRGFGYDPMFVPTGGRLTFGEMAPEDKQAISHRAQAFELLVKACLAG